MYSNISCVINQKLQFQLLCNYFLKINWSYLTHWLTILISILILVHGFLQNISIKHPSFDYLKVSSNLRAEDLIWCTNILNVKFNFFYFINAIIISNFLFLILSFLVYYLFFSKYCTSVISHFSFSKKKHQFLFSPF